MPQRVFSCPTLDAALIVVEANPVSDNPAGTLQTLKAVPMHALLLQRPDDA